MEQFNIIYHTGNHPATPTIHLSATLQQFLKAQGSNIQLDKDQHGELSIGNAWIKQESGRGFSASSECDIEFVEPDFYTIYLSVDQFQLARAKVVELEQLAHLIYDWMEKELALPLLVEKYSVIELFTPISGLSAKKAQAWNNIKHTFFCQAPFGQSNHRDWIHQYNEMLEVLSNHPKLDKYTPFTSHFRLHLNNASKSLPWHFIHPLENGKFQVAEQRGISPIAEASIVDERFETLEEAIQFYVALFKKLEADFDNN